MKNLSEQVTNEFQSYQDLVYSDTEFLEADEVMNLSEFTIHEDAVLLSTEDSGMEFSEAVSVLAE